MANTAADISTPKQLAAMVEGRSDADIIQAVNEIGIDGALAKVFEGMKAQFLPKKAAGQTATVQWDVQANGKSHLYQVVITNGECDVKAGNSLPARVTLTLQLPDFLRLVTGKLNGQQAFFSGKLKLAGDMMFAMTQQGWFDMSFAG